MSNVVVGTAAVVFLAAVLAACGKSGENRNDVASKHVAAPDRYEGWKDYAFADGKFSVKYPADKAVLPEPRCYVGRISGCNFNTGSSGLRLSWGKIDRAPSEFMHAVIDGEKARGKLLELHDVKVNGIDAKEFVVAAEKDGDMRFRTLVAGDTFVMIFGFNLKSKFSESKEEIDKFIESMSPVQTKAASP